MTEQPPEVEEAYLPDDKSIMSVAKYALRLRQIDERLANYAKVAEQLKEERQRLVDVDLPTALHEMGAKAFTLNDGSVVEVTTVVRAGITEANKAKAHKWLEKHGHGSIIKRRIQILFGRAEEAWAEKFMKDCAKRKKKLAMATKEWVEPQTLGAFVREQRKQAEENGFNPDEAIPGKLFGVFVQRTAVIKPPPGDA